MWWNKAYVSRRDWILENLGVLKLSANETVIVLMVDFMNENLIEISLEELAARTGLDVSVVDTSIQQLVGKSFLSVRVDAGAVHFEIDGLFQDGVMYEFVDKGIFETFEVEFGRLMSQSELETLNLWLSKYTQEEILDALGNAIIYKKVSMQYINAILHNMEQERK